MFLGVPFSATIELKSWMGLGLFDLHPCRLLLHPVIVGFVEGVSVGVVEVLGVHWASIGFVVAVGHPTKKGLESAVVEV